MDTGQPPTDGGATIHVTELQDEVPPANPEVKLNMQAAAQTMMQPSGADPFRLGSLQGLGTTERGPASLGVGPLAAPQPITTTGVGGSMNNTMAQLAQLNAAMNAQMNAQITARLQQLPQYQQMPNAIAQNAGMASAGGFNPQQSALLLNLLQQQQRSQQMMGMGQPQQQQQQGQHAFPPYGSPYQFMQPNFGAQMRQPGQVPPAKRQAMGVGQTPMMTNPLMQMQQLQMAQLMAVRGMPFQQFLPRPAQQSSGYGSRQSGYNSSRGAMRVQIDKRNRSSYDAHFLAEETNEKAHADEVVKRCEEISKALKSHLGNTAASDRFGATDTDTSYQQVTIEKLKECCGNTARYLKPYQIVGVNFLMLLYRTRIGGAILADEMGLGKTAQLITYLGAIRNLENDPGPHLVVVPASLLENWQRELRRWCPGLKTVVYYGKHRGIVRKRLNALREKIARGEPVDDDLADLADADMLAEAAASERVAEAAAMAAGEPKDEDPLGLGIMHESDDEFDLKRDTAKDNGKDLGPVEEAPIRWDPNTPLQGAPFNVMLTCYTLFERDSPEQRDDRKFLESWRWSHLIMDEAHALKNRNASRTTRLRRVANASRRRIMMTGTPLQNDLLELQNLLHFLLPQVFAAQGMEDFADMLQGDENEINRLTDRMKSLLGPFVLRRLKTEVAGQLTEKKHATEFINMTEKQQELYEASVQQMRSQIAASKTGSAAGGEGGEASVEKFMKTLGAKKINHIFTHLRKIAQHPLLIRAEYDDATVDAIAIKAVEMNIFAGNVTKKKVLEELMNYSDYSLHAFCYNHGPEFFMFRLNSKHLMASAKFKFLGELLPKLKAEGSRPLIFSQWTAVLDIVEWLMDELQLPYVRLDGSTAVDERLATVDIFNGSEDVFAFLLSTRAGGQGLNLTGADTVIIHDVDFNPQIDRQAEDRCHRLGQTRPVMVYRLITKSTVDQNIFNLSQRKLKLDRAVLDGITSGKGAGRGGMTAEERQQMGFILHSLFAGKEDYEQMAVMPDEIEDEQPEWKKEKEDKAKEKEKAAAAAAGQGAGTSAPAAPAAAPTEMKIKVKIKALAPPPPAAAETVIPNGTAASPPVAAAAPPPAEAAAPVPMDVPAVPEPEAVQQQTEALPAPVEEQPVQQEQEVEAQADGDVVAMPTDSTAPGDDENAAAPAAAPGYPSAMSLDTLATSIPPQPMEATGAEEQPQG